MDVFVAPYLVETFGMALVEAMGMGIPVLHFNLGGIQASALPPLSLLALGPSITSLRVLTGLRSSFGEQLCCG